MKQKLLCHYVYSACVMIRALQPQSCCSSGTIGSTCPVPQVEPIISWEAAIRGGACSTFGGSVGSFWSWSCWFCSCFVTCQIHLFTTCASVDPVPPVRTLNYLTVPVRSTILILSSSLSSECPDGFSVHIFDPKGLCAADISSLNDK